MKALTCPNCGGTINEARMICEYCGTRFESNLRLDDLCNPLRIISVPSQTKTYQAMMQVPNYVVAQVGDENHFKDYVINELSYKLAKAIAPNMDIEIADDIRHNSQEIHARVRIVTNDYRY